jgi:hypothetical protein
MTPTAYEFTKINTFTSNHQAMIAFAKIHVEAALKSAVENAELTRDSANNEIIDKDSILNAYPLENIK